MKITLTSLSLAAACLLSAVAAQAQNATPAAPGASAAAMQAINAACHDDFATLCPNNTPGDGKLKECIKANRAKLSSGCKSELRNEMKARKAAKEG